MDIPQRLDKTRRGHGHNALFSLRNWVSNTSAGVALAEWFSRSGPDTGHIGTVQVSGDHLSRRNAPTKHQFPLYTLHPAPRSGETSIALFADGSAVFFKRDSYGDCRVAPFVFTLTSKTTLDNAKAVTLKMRGGPRDCYLTLSDPDDPESWIRLDATIDTYQPGIFPQDRRALEQHLLGEANAWWNIAVPKAHLVAVSDGMPLSGQIDARIAETLPGWHDLDIGAPYIHPPFMPYTGFDEAQREQQGNFLNDLCHAALLHYPDLERISVDIWASPVSQMLKPLHEPRIEVEWISSNTPPSGLEKQIRAAILSDRAPIPRDRLLGQEDVAWGEKKPRMFAHRVQARLWTRTALNQLTAHRRMEIKRLYGAFFSNQPNA